MGTLFAELKRRHIYRVGAGYVVVAWALTQVIDVLSQIYGLPAWIAQPAVAVLAIGFPIALIAAWIIERKPHEAIASAVHSKSAAVDWMLIGAVAVLIALTGYQQIAPRSASLQQAGLDTTRRAAVSPATAISLAVLPFSNLSGDPSQEFFSDGMTEEITTALAKVPDLRVVGRTSAFQFKGENKDLRAIGQALNATHLIEGSVRKAGNRLRITAQLIKADDGTHIWAENYDRELTDVFAVQEDIARAITASFNMSLGLKSGEQLVSNRAIDPESYQQFLRGKVALLKARYAYAEQLAILEPVVAKNPNYAPAWSAVAQAYRYAAQIRRAGSAEEARTMRASFESKMRAAANRAVELDPNFVDGKVMLARIQSGPRRLIQSEEFVSAALTLDPNNPGALDYYSSLLGLVGRSKEAVTMKQQVHLLEPYGGVYSGNLAQALLLDGQTDAAIALCKENLDVEGAGCGPMLGLIYASFGRYEDAAAIADDALSIPRNQQFRDEITAFARLMRTAPAKATAPEKLPQLPNLNFVYLFIGAPERVLDGLEEGIPTYNELSLLWTPPYKPVRNTERFKKILLNQGLIDYWRERGWPRFCHPTTGTDFACD